MFGIKRRFQRCKVWPPRTVQEGLRTSASNLGIPLEDVRFMLLSTNLAREWLQIDTDLLRIITSTADELSGDTNVDDLERPWPPKIWVLSDFLYFSLRCTLRVNFRWNILEVDQDNLRTKLNWCCLMNTSSDFLYVLGMLFDKIDDVHQPSTLRIGSYTWRHLGNTVT